MTNSRLKPDPTGRNNGRVPGKYTRKRFQTVRTPFAPRPVAMLSSPAFRVLSRAARLTLDRLEIELSGQGGHVNGAIVVTFDDLEKHGLDRHSIGPAVRELACLGFVEVKPGAAGNAEFRQPNVFRLTYLAVDVPHEGPATDDWERIQTMDEARALARSARETRRENEVVQRRRRLAS